MLRARYAAAVPVARAFAQLTHGAMHYRWAGDGPVVLALHESPRSSLSMHPVIEALCDSRRVIAPDTPGYGLSDPLAGEAPQMADFVAALAEFLDALGVRRVALYGAHTGAAIAIAFAATHPSRVTALVLDGVSAFNAQEVADFRDRYLVPYVPRWDGGHVMGLWSRVKDLFTWFPWYEQTAARRLAGDPGDLEALQRSALGFFQSGPHYAKAYIRAASFDPNAWLPAVTAPVTIMARPDDLIADHLARIASGPWSIVPLARGETAWAQGLRDALGKGPDADRQGAAPPAGCCRFEPVGDGWLHLRQAGPLAGERRVVLPGLPGDSEAVLARQAAAHPAARVTVIDLPGCGRSDPLSGAGGLDGVLEALGAVMGGLGVHPDCVVGEGASGVVAALWGQALGAPWETVDEPAWLRDAAVLPERPPLSSASPQWDGRHMTGGWMQLRDLALYDTPPGAGPPHRRAGAEAGISVAALDRLFRAYVEGPDCADLLWAVIERLRAEPGLLEMD